jgi:hypothetical protein
VVKPLRLSSVTKASRSWRLTSRPKAKSVNAFRPSHLSTLGRNGVESSGGRGSRVESDHAWRPLLCPLGLGERADPSRSCGAVGEPNEPGLRGLPRLVAGALGPRLSAWRTFCVPRFSRSRSREPYRATRKESRVDLGKRCAARVAGPAAVSVESCPRPASRRVDGAWSACLGRRLHAPG